MEVRAFRCDAKLEALIETMARMDERSPSDVIRRLIRAEAVRRGLIVESQPQGAPVLTDEPKLPAEARRRR